jgi:ectoine hydroxylase-related dioxygenase (phytanoyl-CoA dioxygenase family)
VPVLEEYGALFERLVADWLAQGLVRSDYAELLFAQRWARLLTDTGAAGFPPLDVGSITDATVENGCLCVVAGSHKRGLATHCPGGVDRPLAIPDAAVEAAGEVKPLPLRSGGVVFLHRLTMHGSLSNTSDGIRWSFDLRYQPVGQPTGRPRYPSFVARSRHDRGRELHDWRTWATLWTDTRARIAADPDPFTSPVNRWDGSEAVCA